MSSKNFIEKFNPVVLAFAISMVYWVYLMLNTSMVIGADAIGFEKLGKILLNNGWKEYFSMGPTREPLYPFLISISMKLESFLSLPYEKIQAFFQLLILFFTQWITLKILRRFKIQNSIISLIILYLGFSPTIVNSALSLYSEILTYLPILGIVYFLAKTWKSLLNSEYTKIPQIGILISILFILAISVKAIFQYVLILILIPFIFLIFHFFANKQYKSIIQTILLISIVFSIPNIYIHAYKTTNKNANGKYAFTDRGFWMLYASSFKRTEKLSPLQIATFLTSIPGDGVCQSLFEKKDCKHWSSEMDSTIGAAKTNQFLDEGKPFLEIDDFFIDLTKERIMKNPLQLVLFLPFEGLKMFFWESTQIGHVRYPKLLKSIFDFTLFKNSLRLIASIITIWAFFFQITYIIRNRKFMLDSHSLEGEIYHFQFFSAIMIISVIGLYSLFTILTRFSFLNVPLYLISIAFLINHRFFKS